MRKKKRWRETLIYHLDSGEAQFIVDGILEAFRGFSGDEMVRQREARKERELDQQALCFRCGIAFPKRLLFVPMNLYQHPGQKQYHCAGCLELLKEEYFYTCAVCERRCSPHFNYHPYFCSFCRTDERSKESTRVQAHLERAKTLGVPATLTVRQWLATLDYFSWKCAYCLASFNGLEHYLPIGLGGGTTADNCLPYCRSCNTRKGDKHPDDFLSLFPAENMVRIRSYLEQVKQS